MEMVRFDFKKLMNILTLRLTMLNAKKYAEERNRSLCIFNIINLCLCFVNLSFI